MILKIDNDCYKQSKLHKGRKIVNGEGPVPCRIMFIGEAPGAEEQASLRPFVGKAGKVLNIALKVAGIKRSEIFLTNTVKNRPPKNRDPNAAEIKAYLPILQEEIDIIDPDLIVLLGGVATIPFFGRKGVESRRGYLHKHSSETFGDRNVLVTYHPSAFLHGNPMWNVFIADLRRARRIVEDKFEPTVTDVHIVDTLGGVKDLVDILHDTPYFAFDLETSGFNYFDDIIANYSFSIQEGESFIVPLYDTKEKSVFRGKTRTAVDALMYDLLLREGGVAGACTWNGQFDFNFLQGNLRGMDFYRGQFDNWFMDGMLMHNLLEEEMPHKLEYVAAVHTDMLPWSVELGKYKEEHKIKSYIDIPGHVLWPYAAGDTDATLRLINLFLPRLKEEGLFDFYFDQQHEIAKVIAHIGFRGIPLNLEALDALKEEYEIKRDTLEQRVYTAAGKEFNTKSWMQKAQILYQDLGLPEVGKRTKSGNPSTDAPTMEALAKLDLHPLPALLAEMGSVNRLVDGYLGSKPGSLRTNVGADGRCRCNWMPQETGRYGANSPNLLNIPREGGFREIFEVPPGWKLIEADYSQAELRYAAYRSGEVAVIEALEAGYDGHQASAAAVFGVPIEEVTPQQRSIGKTVNFLIQYGGGPQTLADAAGITVGKARGIIKRFFAMHPCLDAMMKNIAKRAQAVDDRDRVVINVFGRIRHIPISLTRKSRAHVVRSAINSDAQGGIADAVWRAMIELYKWFREMGLQAHFVLVLHDGVYVMCPDDEVDLVKKKMEEVMLQPLPEIDAVIPVDFKVQQRWESKG